MAFLCFRKHVGNAPNSGCTQWLLRSRLGAHALVYYYTFHVTGHAGREALKRYHYQRKEIPETSPESNTRCMQPVLPHILASQSLNYLTDCAGRPRKQHPWTSITDIASLPLERQGGRRRGGMKDTHDMVNATCVLARACEHNSKNTDCATCHKVAQTAIYLLGVGARAVP